MSDISALIKVYEMKDVSKQTRADIIVKLGQAINYSFSSNVCEPIVVELVRLLVPNHEIFSQEHYQEYLATPPNKESK